MKTSSFRIISVVSLPVSILSIWLSNYVLQAGVNISQDNILTDYLVGWLWSIFLAVGLIVLPFPRQHKKPLILLWIAKTVLVLGIMLAYEYHYELDAFSYYDSARHDNIKFAGLQFGDGTSIVIWLVSLQFSILPESYHAAKVTFSFLGLMSIY